MPLIPPRLWASPLTRAYEAEEYRAARLALLAGVPLAVFAFALAALGGLDPLTTAMCTALFGLIGWALAYEALIWRRFGAGSLYMAWARRISRAWWRRIGLSSRASPERASTWLERHAHDPGLTADRAAVNAVLRRSAQARAEIARLAETTAAERWARQRLHVLIDLIEGGGHAALQELRRLVTELDDPRVRMFGEADLIGFEIEARVAAGGDWRRELRLAVDRANEKMVAAGLDEWRFRLRMYDRAAHAAAGLMLAVLTALLIALLISTSSG